MEGLVKPLCEEMATKAVGKDEKKNEENTHSKTTWSVYQLRLIDSEVWSSGEFIVAYLL